MSSIPYRSLGNCGTKVSALSLGGWTTYGGSVTDKKRISSILHNAFEAGINFFDIADIYARGETERVMGECLRDLPRHHLVVSSKVFFPMSQNVNDRGLSRKHIFESVEMSLKRFGTDHFDIYFCHRYDEETPLEETVRAMDDLVRQGKVIYWGTSEWSREQLQEAHRICREVGYYRPQVEQPQYSLMVRKRVEREIVPFAEEVGMGLVTWSPLASGFLTGKYDKGIPSDSRLANIGWLKEELYNEENQRRVREMKVIADEMGCTRSQLALGWLLRQRGVSSIITGATSVEQLSENLGALRIELSAEAQKRLERIFT